MTTVRAALASGVARLKAAGIAEAAGDARRLMAAALGVAPDRLTLMLPDPLPDAAAAVFDAHLAGRAARQPVARLLGVRAFWGRDFAVTPAVLDPRPETETLVAAALEGPPARRLLDLGTGSGILLVSLLAEWPDAAGLGTDRSAAALAVAAQNAARHGVAARAAFRSADWLDGIAGPYDLVVSNPPYIPSGTLAGLAPEVRDWDPEAALTAGPSGLEAYVRIAAGLAAVLAPGGRALFEFGAGQGPEVLAVFRAAGFADLALRADFDGRPRCLVLRAPG